jgi:hypothetical protein
LAVQRVEVDAVGLVSDQQVVAGKIRAIAAEVDAEPENARALSEGRARLAGGDWMMELAALSFRPNGTCSDSWWRSTSRSNRFSSERLRCLAHSTS